MSDYINTIILKHLKVILFLSQILILLFIKVYLSNMKKTLYHHNYDANVEQCFFTHFKQWDFLVHMRSQLIIHCCTCRSHVPIPWKIKQFNDIVSHQMSIVIWRGYVLNCQPNNTTLTAPSHVVNKDTYWKLFFKT